MATPLPKVVVTIAGSDPSGGAGLQRDLLVFENRGVYGLSVVTALTSQNTQGVQRVAAVAAGEVQSQLQSLFEDFEVAAAKIGMLCTEETVMVIAGFLRSHPVQTVVLDPILHAKDGTPLLSPEGLVAMQRHLLPVASLVTPNLAEASALTGCTVDSIESMRRAADALRRQGARSVVVKGGHLAGEPVDLLVDGDEAMELPGDRVHDLPVRGTGCMFSAVVTAEMAKGNSLKTAVRIAKDLVSTWIREARSLGKGNRVVT